MKKNILYVILGLMGLMGTLAIGVVSAETTISEPYGHIEYKLNGNEDFGAQVITITGDDGTVITILDRNLGATVAGTGCEGNCPNRGYLFQWGNNYGFIGTGDLQSNQKDNTLVNADLVGIPYMSGIFHYGNSNWLNDNSKVDLWGGSVGDSIYNIDDKTWQIDNAIDRRGPCPEGFHIPSKGELQKIRSMMGYNASEMHNKLLIPFVGLRGYNAAEISSFGNSAYIRSSTYNLDGSYNSYSRFLYLSSVGGQDVGLIGRAIAGSIRCFYNKYETYSQTVTLNFTGSEGGSVSTGSIEVEGGSSISRDDEAGSVTISGTVVATGIADEGYVFSGWLTDCDGDTVTTGCSFTGVFKTIQYTITYLGTGDDYVPLATGFTIKSDDITLSKPSKTGYTFTGRSGTNIEGITGTVTISEGSTGNRIYEANWEANEYTITIDIDGNETILTGKYGDPISKPADPSKNGYKFIGWEPEFPTTMPLSGATVKAKWEKLGSSGGGGGRSSKTSSDSEKTTEGQAGSQQPLSPQQASDSSPDREQTVTPLIGGDGEARGGGTQTYTQEFQEAYEFAKGKGITTMPTIQKANMEGKLTRIAMAKMLSQYAMNVLGQKPANIVTPKFNDVTDKQNSDYDDGVTLAYQLGIMGQNMPNNKFRPDDEVTRAEFATALSRMLYHTSDGEYKSTDKYYTNHMENLVKEGIITNDDPNMKELRGYVMIMLMRSAK